MAEECDLHVRGQAACTGAVWMNQMSQETWWTHGHAQTVAYCEPAGRADLPNQTNFETVDGAVHVYLKLILTSN